jgi:hypothetical protein
MTINPHLQPFIRDIFFHIMGFSPSPKIDEPSLSNTKVNGHLYTQITKKGTKKWKLKSQYATNFVGSSGFPIFQLKL